MVIFALSTSAEKSPLLERVALLILALQDAVRSLHAWALPKPVDGRAPLRKRCMLQLLYTAKPSLHEALVTPSPF